MRSRYPNRPTYNLHHWTPAVSSHLPAKTHTFNTWSNFKGAKQKDLHNSTGQLRNTNGGIQTTFSSTLLGKAAQAKCHRNVFSTAVQHLVPLRVHHSLLVHTPRTTQRDYYVG